MGNHSDDDRLPVPCEALTALEAGRDEELYEALTAFRAERGELPRVLAGLGEDDLRVLSLLLSDPPLSYAEISEIMVIPRECVGLARARCLARLRGAPRVDLGGLAGADRTRAASPLWEARHVGNRPDDNLQPGLRDALANPATVPDEVLIAALREAIAAREAVPPAFVAAAKSAYAWHSIDAELAQLTYDSRLETELAAGLRSESASIRALSFASARLSIEVEITGDTLLGQLIPARPGTVEVQAFDGGTVTVPVDEAGCFTVDPKPGSTFRLRCHTGHTGTQTDVLTGWVTL